MCGAASTNSTARAVKNAASKGGKPEKSFYLVGGLYVRRRTQDVELTTTTTTTAAPPLKEAARAPTVGAWGIIGIVLAVLFLSSAIYYTLYLWDLWHRKHEYSVALQGLDQVDRKVTMEENGNGNTTMTDMNKIANGKEKTPNQAFL